MKARWLFSTVVAVPVIVFALFAQEYKPPPSTTPDETSLKEIAQRIQLPAQYGTDPGRRWLGRVVLHGRDTSLHEVKFLHQHDGDKPAHKEQEFVAIDIYGRGNNAYRWAGETDVNEAIESFLATERAL